METLTQAPSQDSASRSNGRGGAGRQDHHRNDRTQSHSGRLTLSKAKSEGAMTTVMNNNNNNNNNYAPNQQHLLYPQQQQQQYYQVVAAAPPPRYGMRTVHLNDSQEQQPQPHHNNHNDRQARRSSRRQHRKSHSSSAALSNNTNNGDGYGAFWGTQQQQQQTVLPEHYHAPPMLAPGGGAFLSSSVPLNYHHVRRGSWGQPPMSSSNNNNNNNNNSYPPPPSPGSASSPRMIAAKSFDPRFKEMRSIQSRMSMSPKRSPVYNLSAAAGDLQFHNLPPPPILMHSSPSWSNPSPDISHNSESYSLLNPKRRESSRRKHMRQHSVQVYMETTKGTLQPRQCRDVIYLMVFVTQLLAIVYLGQLYFQYAISTTTTRMMNDNNNSHADWTNTVVGDVPTTSTYDDDKETVTLYYNTLLYAACLCGSFAMILSAMLLGIMTVFARQVVQVALIFAMTLSFVWGTIGIGLSPRNFVPITGIIALALSVAYAFVVWDRIPFASANVLTALTAIQAYPGLTLVALMIQAMALGWSIYFCVVVVGVYDAIQQGELILSQQWKVVLYTSLGMSYYWTFQVLSNTLKACTASVVEAWWHESTDEHVVSNAVSKTMFSLGSICYGSLFVGPVSLIRQLAVLFIRPNQAEDAPLLCFHECINLITNCLGTIIDALSRRFTPWAICFVGLYNYSFADAAYHVTDLFEKRGWTMIVSDDLIPNILLMTSLVLGGMTGCLGHLLEWMDVWQLTSLGEPGLVSFVMGAIIGVVLSSILFGMIHSSVNTVLICFASEPVTFAKNHSELSDEMREAWREVWPGALDIMDMRMALAHARASSATMMNHPTTMGNNNSPRSTVQHFPEQAPSSFLPPAPLEV